jgi:hypothetical protein
MKATKFGLLYTDADGYRTLTPWSNILFVFWNKRTLSATIRFVEQDRIEDECLGVKSEEEFNALFAE